MSIRILQGDCRAVMATLPECSVDAIVTDPPYELGFMGKGWDRTGVANDVETWRQALRVLKPGGHLLAFSGTRTYHRMACAIEDAGFEVRDQLGWVFGSGFPKSLDVSKAIDKAAGAEREVLGPNPNARSSGSDRANGWDRPWQSDPDAAAKSITAPATEAAAQWQGWGTALKPAWEPVCMARKPLAGTVAANVLQHGTGALNIDGCRVDGEVPVFDNNRKGAGSSFYSGSNRTGETREGRWPANLIHDGSEEVVAAFPASNGSGASRVLRRGERAGEGWGMADQPGQLRDAGTGSAARFFWSPKASRSDRNEGLDGVPTKQQDPGREAGRPGGENPRNRGAAERTNHHPTVKPTDLMRYLCRLVTPPGGVVLDPFMGSGSTLKAAELEGFSAIGIELSAEYIEIARRRIAADAPLFASVEVA